MQEKQFLQIVKNFDNISIQDVSFLKKLLQKYPYCQLIYILLAKKYYQDDKEAPFSKLLRQLASLYTTDKGYLQAFLQGKLFFLASSVTRAIQKQVSEKYKKKSELEGKNITNTMLKTSSENREKKKHNSNFCLQDPFIDKSTSFKKKYFGNEQSLAHKRVISPFIEKNDFSYANSIRVKDLIIGQNVDLSQESAKLKQEIVTENLAKVMLKQGRRLEAQKIYTQLLKKYPQKKKYFAKKIQELEGMPS